MAIIKGRRNRNGVRPRGTLTNGMWVRQQSTGRVGILVDNPALVPAGTTDVETPCEQEVAGPDGNAVLDAQGEPTTEIVIKLVAVPLFDEAPGFVNVHFVDDQGETIMRDAPDPNDSTRTVRVSDNVLPLDDVAQADHADIMPHLDARASTLSLAQAHRLGYDLTPEAKAAHEAELEAASVAARVRGTLRGASTAFVSALKAAIDSRKKSG